MQPPGAARDLRDWTQNFFAETNNKLQENCFIISLTTKLTNIIFPLRLKRHEVARPKPRVCLEDGAMFAKFGDLNARLFRREFRGHANSTLGGENGGEPTMM